MRELKAYCSSRKCASEKVNYVIKDAKKTQVNCLDCGSVLLWKKENTRMVVKDVVHKRNRPRKLRGEI